jgi:hypothetical protein
MYFLKWFIEERFAWYENRMSDLLNDYHHFLLASKPQNAKKEWKYLMRESTTDYWFTEEYIDNHWETGLAPFGTQDNLQSTYWGDAGTILIRTHFEVEEDAYNRIKDLYLNVFHDEDCWIYINGEEVMNISGYNTTWESFAFDKQYLRPGTNLIAIKCTQTVGGQLIDAGIYATLEENTGVKTVPKAEYEYTVRDNLLSINHVKPNTPINVYGVDGKVIKKLKVSGSKVEIRLPYRGVYLIQLEGRTLKVVN